MAAERPARRAWAIIGCGKMATALWSRIFEHGEVERDEVVAIHRSEASCERTRATLGVRATTDWQTGLRRADAVMLGFKPQQFTALEAALHHGIQPDAAVVSLLAGTRLQSLRRALGDRPVVRAMPNTPVAVGAGVTALAHGGDPASAAWADALQAAFAPLGTVLMLDEQALEAITPLSGSGPAYVYLLLEAFELAARRHGFDDETARVLARETVAGAAALASAQPTADPADLRRAVTSPGGVTEAALATLLDGAWPQTFCAAIDAGSRRNAELAGDDQR